MSGQDWMLQAACRDTDPEVPFSSEADQAIFAGKYCHGCPVREECLRFGLANDPAPGVFGGFTARQRKALVKRQARVVPKVVATKQRLQRQPSRTDPRCGTTSGYRRHLRAKEATCNRCRRAWLEYAARRSAA